MVIIGTISPSMSCYEDTLCTLKFISGINSIFISPRQKGKINNPKEWIITKIDPKTIANKGKYNILKISNYHSHIRFRKL